MKIALRPNSKRLATVLLALAAMSMLAVSTSLAAKGDRKAARAAKAGDSAAVKDAGTQAASALPYPPTLPDGKTVATDTSDDFLKPAGDVKAGVLVAKTAPTVDFLYFPGQDHPGKPWSVWGDGSVAGGKYYTAIGDHMSPKGTAQVYEYDPAGKTLRMLVDVRKFLEASGTLPSDMNYTPGKIHARIQMGSDGCIYYSTHRGSARTTTDEYGYKGDWIFKTDPKTAKTEIAAAFPVPKHCIPASSLDAERLIYYGSTASGKDAPAQGPQFFAYDLKNHKVLISSSGGFQRYAIFSSSTGKIFWKPSFKGGDNDAEDDAGDAGTPSKVYDPATNKITDCHCPSVRSATTETKDGWVYGTTGRMCDIWAYNVKTDKVEQIGNGQASSASYTTTMEVDPTGRYLYYVPGGHGGGARDGGPIVQYDLKTRKVKVLAYLYDFYHKKYGYSLDGTFSTALDEKGETLFISWSGWRDGAAKKGWESCAMTAIHIPQSERQP